jgi:hypothetical protein
VWAVAMTRVFEAREAPPAALPYRRSYT